MSAKLMDLPTIVESHKSIDRKSFYKTADICQVMIITRTKAMEQLVETTTSINIGAGSDYYKYKGCGAAGDYYKYKDYEAGGDYNQYKYPGAGADLHF